jgi:hypothetical protein
MNVNQEPLPNLYAALYVLKVIEAKRYVNR